MAIITRDISSKKPKIVDPARTSWSREIRGVRSRKLAILQAKYLQCQPLPTYSYLAKKLPIHVYFNPLKRFLQKCTETRGIEKVPAVDFVFFAYRPFASLFACSFPTRCCFFFSNRQGKGKDVDFNLY